VAAEYRSTVRWIRALMTFVPPVTKETMMHVSDLVSKFESLGDNCEFGIVQRRCGVEPLGLFRFNWADVQALEKILESGLEDIGSREKMNISLSENSDEYDLLMPEYGFCFHTFKKKDEIDPEKLLDQQVKTQTFLKRKLIDDFRKGEKIFVRKSARTNGVDQAQRLLSLLEKYGSPTLLWVVQEDDCHPRGMVEVIEERLLKGYIDRFAPLFEAVDVSDSWINLCRNAHALFEARAPIGTKMCSPVRPETTNLLRPVHLYRRGIWVAPFVASLTTDLPAPPPEAFRSKVAGYKLTSGTGQRPMSIMGYQMPGLLHPMLPMWRQLTCTFPMMLKSRV
jgi:hypothetical protein